MLRQHWFLQEKRVKRLQFFCKHLCHTFMYASMEVNGDIKGLPGRLSYCANARQYVIHLGKRIDVMHLARSIHLDRCKSFRHSPACSRSNLGWAVTTYPGIHTYLVTHAPTKKLMDRHAVVLSLHVPQGLVNTGHCTHQHRTSAVEAATVQHLPYFLDSGGVLSNEVLACCSHCGSDRLCVPFKDRFSPSADTAIGRKLEKEPARRYLKQFQCSNLHKYSL